jgi:maltooligosyltrehalose trehalohydrolase
VLGPEALVLRFFADDPRLDRLLLLNLGVDLPCGHLPEPLLACSAGHGWQILWSSEDAIYGGCGTGKVELESTWILPGHSALLLVPGPG